MTLANPTAACSADDRLNALVAGLHAERKGRAWEGECPCHEYRRHLGIGIRNDKVLVKCHGSPPASQDELIAALRALDLWPDTDPLAEPRAAALARKANGEPMATDADGNLTPTTGLTLVAAYDYVDPATGAVLGTKRRYEPKAFSWTGHDGRQVAALPLFNAHKLGRLAVDRAVFMTEGEKAALAVEANLKRAAVCGPGGAGQRDWGAALDALAGRPVVLWRDNDPPGEAWARYLVLALAGVASEIRVIVTGERPNDDADDFFGNGGAVAEVVRLVQAAPPETPVVEPTIAALGDDAYEVVVPDGEGYLARFEFADVSVVRPDVIEANVSVRYGKPGVTERAFRARANVASTNKRDDLVKGIEIHLDEQVGRSERHRWAKFVSDACSLVLEAVGSPDRVSVDLGELPAGDDLAPAFVAHPLVLHESVSLLFGEKGAGKSYIAMLLSICVALGLGFLGRPTRQMNVMYCNYEPGGPKAVNRRLRRLLLGLGVAEADLGAEWARLKKRLFVWSQRGLFVQQLPTLRRVIAETDAGLVVVDSAGAAAGSEPEKADTAIAFYNAVNSLRKTALVLHHVVKGDKAQDTPFGSTYWRNFSRLNYNVQRDKTASQSDVVDLALIPRDYNEGRVPMPLGLVLTFDGVAGPVTLKVNPLGVATGLDHVAPLAERILAALADGPMTNHGLADELTAPIEQVQARLNDLRRRGRVVKLGGGRWGLASLANDEPEGTPC